VFDDRLRTVVADVGDADAVASRTVRVDVVSACCCQRDEPEIRCILQQLTGQANLVGKDDLGVTDTFRDRRVGRIVVNDELRDQPIVPKSRNTAFIEN
jgi:hypothetical protein